MNIQDSVGAFEGTQTFASSARLNDGVRQFAENIAVPLRLVDGKKLEADLRSTRTSYSREPLLGSHARVDISPPH